MIDDFGFPEIETNFEEALQEATEKKSKEFTQGDKVTGIISKISPSGIFININDYYCEGIIGYEELLSGNFDWKEGNEITAFFLQEIDSVVNLTTKIFGEALDNSLQEAFEKKIPVEGRVLSEKNGGFSIKLGTNEAFCPFSQIAIYKSNEEYIGKTYLFLITKINDNDLVVSRRQLLQEEAEEQLVSLQESLKVGDELEGIIRRIETFGLFVDLGGLDGLVHKSELSWNRRFDLNDYFNRGDKVSVIIRSLDWANKRIGLGLRETLQDPWNNIAAKYSIGKKYSGIVTRLTEFGAFIEIEKDFEGLLHISKLKQHKRLNHASEVLQNSQQIDVYIENIDKNSQRISLTLEKIEKKDTKNLSNASDDISPEVGSNYEGTINAIKNFGIFIRLTNKKSGLLHISKCDIPSHMQSLKELETRFSLGSKLVVTVDKIDQGKISLSIAESKENIQQKKLINEYLIPQQKCNNDFTNAFDKLGL